MQREERVVFRLSQERVFRQCQLNTEKKCENTTHEEESETEQEVQNSNFFVVGCGEPRLEVSPEVRYRKRIW